MTERKPPETSFASWIDQRINEAAERGAFDNLPGAGQPIPRRGEAGDGQAWLRDYLRREGVSAEDLLPTPLRLRKEIERLTATVPDLSSEREVRELVTGLNQRILQWRRIPVGPPVYLRLVDEEAMVARWHQARPRPPSPAQASLGPADPPPRWWRRRRPPAPAEGGDPSPDVAGWLAYDETLAGGYAFTADPQAPVLTLSQPLATRASSFVLSVPPRELSAGQCYLLGGPDEPTCEVVQVTSGAPEPDGSRRIRRAMFDTVVMNHPAGTLVTPVTVGRAGLSRLAVLIRLAVEVGGRPLPVG